MKDLKKIKIKIIITDIDTNSMIRKMISPILSKFDTFPSFGNVIILI
jgi:hypothetical protein